MTLSFNIEYRTNWGEEVRVLGSIPELGGNVIEKAAYLSTVDGIHWSQEIEIEKPWYGPIHYCYHIFRDGKSIRSEWNIPTRTLHVSGNSKKIYRIEDCWRNFPEERCFYSSAFNDILLAHNKRASAGESYRQGLCIKAYAPTIDESCCLAICGNQEILGNWNPDKALLMNDDNFPEWQIEMNANKIEFPLEYKFVLYSKKQHKALAWENNPNRLLPDPLIDTNETVCIGDRFVSFDYKPWKGAGVAIPVFSLRSEHSFGIGDFGDLKLMVDWAVATKQRVVQILPINDTTMTHTRTDSYPYNSISIFALNPLYLDLNQLNGIRSKRSAEHFKTLQKELNALPLMDYDAVEKHKWEYIRLAFLYEPKRFLATADFKKFFENNKEWLRPYAAYSYLRDKYHTANFRDWPEHAVYSEKEIEELCHPEAPHYLEIALYYYIQYHLHKQLTAVSQHARANGIVLKGDIPIGISRDSVEAWTEPHYFNLNGQAGAPPDDFSVTGQNWGFPTYNWEVMEKDGYAWWVKRFRKMAEYFDAYRIDHILGFFRIWEIPEHSVHGLLGQFVPSLPMTREEIESYGLRFREEFMLTPYIREDYLLQLFGTQTSYVKQTFLVPTEVEDVYQMKPQYDTQRKIEQFFRNKPEESALRDGLYSLISNVLFVRDRNNPNAFHPRITVQQDRIFQALSEEEQQAFNRLYEEYYYHRHDSFWGEQAMKKLPQLIQSTGMLVCGEDLGMIPGCVGGVINELSILSLEIQRMSKDPMRAYGRPSDYPYRSVCTISTHDMSTFRGWWLENSKETQRFYNEEMGYWGEAPVLATSELCEEIVRMHLKANSMLTILSWQDWMGIDARLRNPQVQDERINIPANPRHYWRWRMHITLEQLLREDRLNKKIKKLIQEAER